MSSVEKIFKTHQAQTFPFPSCLQIKSAKGSYIIDQDDKEYLDFVIHLAALTEATTSIEKPEEYEKINFESTKKVAQLCDTYNVQLVHFSSTSIYGSKENDFIEVIPDN